MKYFNPEKAKKRCLGIYENYLNKEEIEDLASLIAWYNNKVKHVNFEQMEQSQNVKKGTSQ
jgi:fructose-1,6-bisphosphatase